MSDHEMIFVDGANIDRSAEELGFRVDYNKLKQLLESMYSNCQLIRPYYYTADDKNPSRKKFFDKLESFGYDIRTQEIEQRQGRQIQKGVDIQLAVEMLDFGFHNRYDIVILCSGDQDFLPVVKTIKNLGKIVCVAAFSHSCSEKLKRTADRHIDLSNYIEKITYRKITKNRFQLPSDR